MRVLKLRCVDRLLLSHLSQVHLPPSLEQVGNSVAVPAVEATAREIIKVLRPDE